MMFLLSFIACQGTGELDVRAYGEAFIEEGIAASDMEDGWEVFFSSFLVQIDNIALGKEILLESTEVELTQATEGEGQSLVVGAVSAGLIEDLTFRLSKVSVSGSASKDGNTKEFDWEFSTPRSYGNCEGDVSVEKDGLAVFEITIHADHFFYDSLVADEPSLRFEGLAEADGDDDGVLSSEELSEADVGLYDVGNHDISNLWQWIEQASSTLVHSNGEGHCTEL